MSSAEKQGGDERQVDEVDHPPPGAHSGTAERNEPAAPAAAASRDPRDRARQPAPKEAAAQGPDNAKPQVELDEFGLPVRKKDSRAGSKSRLFRKNPEASSKAKSKESSEPPKRNDSASPSPSVQDKEGTQSAGAVDKAEESANTGSRSTSDNNDNALVVPDASTTSENADSQDVQGSHTRKVSAGVSAWSHQRLADPTADDDEASSNDDVGEWKAMPALGELDHYDDYGRLVAKGSVPEDDEAVYSGLGGAGKGYTRIRLDDDDSASAASIDENTSYLFKEGHGTSAGIDDNVRDPLSQLQATKELLTEGQRIAYVGVVRLVIHKMTTDLENIPSTKSSKKELRNAVDDMKKWGQAVMIRLFGHMDIDAAEQVMIEQLSEHGVQPADLVPPLMRNTRVKNPMAKTDNPSSPSSDSVESPSRSSDENNRSPSGEDSRPPSGAQQQASCSPGNERTEDDVPEVQSPSQLPTSENIELDLRWTVLCDLFLVLISDSTYDARSRTLLEQVGSALDISWLQICRFEKRVIDALEMEQEASKETWDEAENMEARRKQALKSKYMIMGLATVSGGLIIGLSAGLLAPVIGAGLAAGLTTIGISGTGAFFGGAGGTALIASGATLTGGITGLRASNRRTGAVKTFEYRPLHNNKRVNLIVTISGWMTGKVDDVRLPFSTVDPIMGDLYSVYWEPEMLQSMGQTINILATEALTQGLQQVLGSTILTALMGALQLPIVLSKLAYLIDNPWNVSLVRANAAGLILADSIMDRNLGKRPITLLGFSLGARVIFSCLKELAKKGAYGLVQNVYLFGSPIVANKDEYLKARSVVSGRFVNGYSSNDWILGYLFRATSGGIMRVAGLAPVKDIPGLENVDVTNLVSGHMNYRAAMPRILRQVGWEVLSDEFAEIEDPDPDDHAERQRELIREIDEARREAEAKPDKRRFGIFKRSRLAQKKGWEMYDVNAVTSSPQSDNSASDANQNVLFDIDAIRAELESEQIEVKQLESTLPPMKLDLSSSRDAPAPSSESSRPELKHSYSADDAVVSEMASSTPATEPTKAPEPGKLDSGPGVPGEEEPRLTFDTDFRDPSQADPLAAFSRPPLHTSSTAPAGLSFGGDQTAILEHNAWAEPDEGEIKMTFE